MDCKIIIYSGNDVSRWSYYYNQLEFKPVYNSPGYVSFIAGHYNYEPELFVLEFDDFFYYYPYFKRQLSDLQYAEACVFDVESCFDIISSWYYGGPLISDYTWLSDKVKAKLFADCFHDYCIQENIVSEFVRFDPNAGNYEIFENIFNIEENRKTVYVDLSQPEDEIRGGYKSSCRNKIRNAEKNGVELKISADPDAIKRFSEIYRSEMNRKEALPHYRFDTSFFMNLFEKLHDSAMLLTAWHEGNVVGGIVCLYGETVAHDFLRTSLWDSRKLNANNIMIDRAIKWCREKGLKIYDIQGGREPVFNFKKNFSKLRKTFFTSKIIHKTDIYNKLCEVREKHGNPVAGGYFPAYRDAE